MQLVRQDKEGLYSISSKEIDLFTQAEKKILAAISKRPSYPKLIAKQLNIHEQNVYYHIRKLEKVGLIRVIRKEEHGAYLAKIYALSSPSFFIKFEDLKKTGKILIEDNKFLYPFIENRELNAKIIVGSPDPHGPERARSRDAYYAIDLGLFLGTFISKASNIVCLDTETHEHDLKNNLILIGGPVINRVTRMINQKLPVRFDEKRNIYSGITKKSYKSDDCGLIVKIKNPLDKEKEILLIAGKRYSGTKAAIIAFVKYFEKIVAGNSKNNKIYAKVVEGVDNDGDGIVDDVRILE